MAQGALPEHVSPVITLVGSLLGSLWNQQENPHSAQEEQVRALVSRIEQSLAEPWPPQRMAALLGVSVATAQRWVRARYGVSLHRLHNELRLLRVCEWLRGSDLRLAEIAERVGIPDAFTLSRLFRHHYGQSPAHWRMQQSTAASPRGSLEIDADH